MIVQWLLYAVLVASWCALAGLLIERVFRSLEWGIRFVWSGVLLLSALAPIVSVWIALRAPAHAGAMATASAPQTHNVWTIVDRTVLLGWLVLSLVLLLSFVFAYRGLLRARRNWTSQELHGVSVWLSNDFGPGVVTFGRSRIVLPSWVLRLDEHCQMLLLEHEREHLRARDPWLIHAGLFLLMLFPFNPILWWQFNRLKLAIEMDCDARVLAGRRNVREYAALLLDVGEKTRAGRFVYAAFAAPPHAIERRIRMMLNRKSKPRRFAVASSAAAALVVAVLACETPEPQSPEPALRAAVGLQAERAKPGPDEPGEVCCHASEHDGKSYFLEYEGQRPDVVPLDVIVERKTLPMKSEPGRYRTTAGGKHLFAEGRLRTAESELPPPPPPPPPPRPKS
jgi:bla regulator protein blaR1